MTLPSEYTFREPEKLVNDLQEMYRLLRESIEGHTEEFTGRIYGSSGEGVGTYTTNACYYVRRANIIDLFYSIVWSAHTGTGDMRILFPSFEKGFSSSVSTSAVRSSGLTWPAGSTSIVLQGEPNQNYGVLQGIRDVGTNQVIQMDGAAGLQFHHRYIGQVEK